MKYYKLLSNNEFIGIVTSKDFIEANPNTGWLLTSNENKGQFVSYKNVLYRDYWMQPINGINVNYTIVNIVEISEEEYNQIKEIIDNNEEVIIDDDDDEEEEYIPEPEDEEDPDIVMAYLRATKINEMSAACRNTIEAGFDLDIRGETKHFSLTTQDQLNLMSLSVMAQTQSLIPYHADGEEVTFYTADEINSIAQAATELKIYNTTYYNALKGYINSLETIGDISAIFYGTPIPEEYKSDVLKILE